MRGQDRAGMSVWSVYGGSKSPATRCNALLCVLHSAFGGQGRLCLVLGD